MNDTLWYAIGVFTVVFISANVLNLLKNHFVFQLTGIAFFFTYFVYKSISVFNSTPDISAVEFFAVCLPLLMGVSACLISMVLGFWLFPSIRRKFRD